MEAAVGDDRLTAETPKEHVSEASLAQAARLVLPSHLAILPVFVVIILVVHTQVSASQIGW